jgi:hypothetical protein
LGSRQYRRLDRVRIELAGLHPQHGREALVARHHGARGTAHHGHLLNLRGARLGDGRASALIEAKDVEDRKAKAQSTWDASKAELDALTTAKPATDLQTLIDNAKADLAKLSPSRPVAEIEALTRGAAMHPNRGGGCTAVNGSLRMSCPKLEAEKARAAQRDRLTGNIAAWTAEIGQSDRQRTEQREKAKAAMDKAAAELATTGPAKVANSDAVALSAYLQGLGIGIDADRANKLLVLLAVLVIECGGGLALAVGMSLSAAAGHAADTGRSGRTQGERTPPDTVGRGLLIPGITKANTCPIQPDTMTGQAADTGPQSPAAVRLISLIRERGGVLVGGQRTMAHALGWSKSKTHELLHALAGDGFVQLTTGRTGTVVRLAATA